MFRENILALISACRQEDLEGYLAALENDVKYFFEHVAQLNALESDIQQHEKL